MKERFALAILHALLKIIKQYASFVHQDLKLMPIMVVFKAQVLDVEAIQNVQQNKLVRIRNVSILALLDIVELPRTVRWQTIEPNVLMFPDVSVSVRMTAKEDGHVRTVNVSESQTLMGL